MSHRYSIQEIESLMYQLDSEAQFIKYVNPGASFKMSMAADLIKQLLFEPMHGMDEDPPFRKGDSDYTGYLVIADNKYKIADYTCEDKHDVDERYPRFYVDGKYEPDVRYWMCLPKIPKASEKFDVHKTDAGMRLDTDLFD